MTPTASVDQRTSAFERLSHIIYGFRATAAVCAAARIGLADALSGEPASASDLAARTDCHPDAVYRLLRALASMGIFEEGPDGRFAHTEMSRLLRSDAAPSVNGMACNTALVDLYAWCELPYSLRTGEPAFEKVFGTDLFDYMKQRPEVSDPFNRTMAAFTEIVAEAVVNSYDFSPYRHIVDVGGGVGKLLSRIAHRYPIVRGVVYDIGHVAAAANERFARVGLSERMSAVGGNFLEHVPSGADLYIIKIVLCDWSDDDARRILRNVRDAMPAGSRLLIIDAILPAGNAPSFAKLSDINMLVLTGGRERTAAEFESLLSASGFDVVACKPVHEWVGLIEAVKQR